MHYIRFLKSPRLVKTPGLQTLTAKITVTTDLGETFLAVDIGLVVELEIDNGDGTGRLVDTKGKYFLWKGRDGMRALEVSIQVPMNKVCQDGRTMKMLVRPKDSRLSVDTFTEVLQNKHGGVVTARSMDVYSSEVGMAERVFNYGKEVSIWEETGESIARHIWDAGVVLSAYLAIGKGLQLPLLHSMLKRSKLKILELGAGCGIVGITLAQFYSNLSSVVLTDLEEATDILDKNLASFSTAGPVHQVLDWSLPLPSLIATTQWDLVLVADCTYNPDVVPDLVKTLSSIRRKGETLVCLAMKVRHESEMVFFDLMVEAGWEVSEKMTLDLPVLGAEVEEIKVYVFA